MMKFVGLLGVTLTLGACAGRSVETQPVVAIEQNAAEARFIQLESDSTAFQDAIERPIPFSEPSEIPITGSAQFNGFVAVSEDESSFRADRDSSSRVAIAPMTVDVDFGASRFNGRAGGFAGAQLNDGTLSSDGDDFGQSGIPDNRPTVDSYEDFVIYSGSVELDGTLDAGARDDLSGTAKVDLRSAEHDFVFEIPIDGDFGAGTEYLRLDGASAVTTDTDPDLEVSFLGQSTQ